MNNNDVVETTLGCFGVIALAILLIIFVPVINFGIAYFGGWICKITFGDLLCNALNTLFNTVIFTPNKLPIMAGALGWIGGYFKTTNIADSIKKNK